MYRERRNFVIAFSAALLGHYFRETYGIQTLEAKLAGAKLPTILYYTTAVYDGDDSVYIFAGNYRSGTTGDILLYSISLDKIWKVSELTTRTYGGLAVPSTDGKSIYYFGGVSNYNIVHKFNSETNYTSRLGTTIPSSILYASGHSMNDGTIHIHNGKYGRNVLEYDEVSEKTKVIADLPFQSGVSVVISNTAISYGKDGGVWLFAGNNPKPKNPVLHFNTTTKTVSIPGPSANVSSMPTLYEYPAAVTDGRYYGYLIGGIGRVSEKDGYYHPSNGILRVNLKDASTEFIQVTNFPGGDEEKAFDDTTAVYVDKLNRIYIFGGLTFRDGYYGYHDSIWYIDLPSRPFDCSALTQGNYPHPTDCASFFICLDGELAGEYSCTPPDLFDPIQQTCNIPEEVACFFSCEGREGLHPHPSDCSKYLVCREGSFTIEVLDCPVSLHFDPVLLRCNLPQLVNCFTGLPVL